MRYFLGILGAAVLLLAPAAAIAVTSAVPGTVTTLIDAHLLTAPQGENHVHGIAKDPYGDIYVADWHSSHTGNAPCFGPLVTNDDTIRMINPVGQVTTLTHITSPNGMAYDVRDHRLYVVTGSLSCDAGIKRTAGPGFHGVIAIDTDTGKGTIVAGGASGFANGTGTEARFTEPSDIAFDSDTGALYISDGYHNRIRRLDPATGAVTALAGSGEKGNADGTGAAATFNYAQGIAYCAADKAIYVADTDNNEIRKVTPDGVVTTVAGAKQAGFADGAPADARFDHPSGIACDRNGNLYVADSHNNAVRQIARMGMVTTLAGGKTPGTQDGIGTAARFTTPGDITYDPLTDAVYVVDWSTNDIRKIAVGQPQP
jgi:DNA-binding beta-propeller fold protein YncE